MDEKYKITDIAHEKYSVLTILRDPSRNKLAPRIPQAGEQKKPSERRRSVEQLF